MHRCGSKAGIKEEMGYPVFIQCFNRAVKAFFKKEKLSFFSFFARHKLHTYSNFVELRTSHPEQDTGSLVELLGTDCNTGLLQSSAV